MGEVLPIGVSLRTNTNPKRPSVLNMRIVRREYKRLEEAVDAADAARIVGPCVVFVGEVSG